MKNGELVLANFDARISNLSIKPKNTATKVIISSKMYDEASHENVSVKIVFSEVAAIDFRINFFDNMIGAEAFGLYRITEKSFVKKLIHEIFERRKEIYLLEGDYDYDEAEPADMLNTLDLFRNFEHDINSYHAYVQNVDAGVYIVVAKDFQILR